VYQFWSWQTDTRVGLIELGIDCWN
jgi:hypothetical protein